MKHLKPFVFAIALCGSGAAANEFEPAMQDYLQNEIEAWMSDPVLLDALRQSNAARAGFTSAQIEAMDQKWRAEVGASNTPTITPVLQNPAAARLREIVEAAGGTITEIILMDATGLNVAVSDVTSDMWQGDEAKHSETFGRGSGSTHFSEVELDESTQVFQGQISSAISDPASSELLGAITVGVNIEELM